MPGYYALTFSVFAPVYSYINFEKIIDDYIVWRDFLIIFVLFVHGWLRGIAVKSYQIKEIFSSNVINTLSRAVLKTRVLCFGKKMIFQDTLDLINKSFTINGLVLII